MDDSHPHRSAFSAQEVVLASVAEKALPDHEASCRAQGVHFQFRTRAATRRLYENQRASQGLPGWSQCALGALFPEVALRFKAVRSRC